MNIVCSSSLAWLYISLAMLFSIRKHSCKDIINAYLIIDADTRKTQTIQDYINSLNFKNIKILLYSSDLIKQNISHEYMQLTNSYWPLITFGKLASYAFLPFFSKAFYFDTDILILNNKIDEYYDIALIDEYAAVVEESSMQYFGKKQLAECKVSRYFNFGVALMNNEKMKNDGIIDQIKHDLINMPNILKSGWNDQSYFNTIFKNNVKFVDPIYNIQTNMFRYPQYDEVAQMYSYHNQIDMINHTCIIHFMKAKPWNNDFYNWQSYQLPMRYWYKEQYEKNMQEFLNAYPKCKQLNEIIVKL